MNDITKNMQLDIISINTRIHELQESNKDLIRILQALRDIINNNTEKGKLLSLKDCEMCNGRGNINNEDHCECCEHHYGDECSNCQGKGELWC